MFNHQLIVGENDSIGNMRLLQSKTTSDTEDRLDIKNSGLETDHKCVSGDWSKEKKMLYLFIVH